MPLDLGQVAFDAYKLTVNKLTHDGKPIPNWNELGENIRVGWRAAADAVVMLGSLETE